MNQGGWFSTINNAYYNSGSWKYKNNGYANQAFTQGGKYYWQVASSGTADNAISWTTAMTIENDGDVTVDTGNLVIGTSGKGIDFSATSDGSGTMTSELLDDYEEGTFTPVLNNTGGTPSYSSQVGKYTKIGNQVLVTVYLNLTVTSSGSNALTISGLPYASVNTAPQTGSIFPVNGCSGTWDMLCPDLTTNATWIAIYESVSTTGQNYDQWRASNLGGSVNFRLHITYEVA